MFRMLEPVLLGLDFCVEDNSDDHKGGFVVVFW